MDNWRKNDGTLFFSDIETIKYSDLIVVVGDDTYFAIKDLYEQFPYTNIVGYVFNADICKRVSDLTSEWSNVAITNNIDDIIYSLYEYSNYTESVNTLIFPGTLSQIRTESSLNQFNDLVQKFLDMDFFHIVIYDSFCYKTLSQLTPLELYFSVINDPKIDKKMLRTYELFYGSIMYYINFIRFFIKYKIWEDCEGGYEWFDILEDCQELSISWNDFVRNIVMNGYRVKYVKMFADSDIKDYIANKTGHIIKVSTQTRAIFTKKDVSYVR